MGQGLLQVYIYTIIINSQAIDQQKHYTQSRPIEYNNIIIHAYICMDYSSIYL